jgi:hypothetical protein
MQHQTLGIEADLLPMAYLKNSYNSMAILQSLEAFMHSSISSCKLTTSLSENATVKSSCMGVKAPVSVSLPLARTVASLAAAHGPRRKNRVTAARGSAPYCVWCLPAHAVVDVRLCSFALRPNWTMTPRLKNKQQLIRQCSIG